MKDLDRSKYILRVEDSRRLTCFDNSIDLIYTSPPYALADIIRYSEEPFAIENSRTYEEFRKGLKDFIYVIACYRILYSCTTPLSKSNIAYV